MVKLGGRSIRVVMMLSFIALILANAPCLAAGSEAPPQEEEIANQTKLKEIQTALGIELLPVRLVGADHFLDFRYRVVDADKAVRITKRPQKAFLIDLKSGRVMPVTEGKLGPLRSTTPKPEAGRNYTILFSNVNKTVGKKDKVAVLIGDALIEYLTVQ